MTDLARREYQVGQLYSQGVAIPQIAVQLECAPVDVLTHLDAMELSVPYAEDRAAACVPPRPRATPRHARMKSSPR